MAAGSALTIRPQPRPDKRRLGNAAMHMLQTWRVEASGQGGESLRSHVHVGGGREKKGSTHEEWSLMTEPEAQIQSGGRWAREEETPSANGQVPREEDSAATRVARPVTEGGGFGQRSPATMRI